MQPSRPAFPTILAAGDGIVFLAATFAGFLAHGEAPGWRMLTIFLPLCAAWAVMAPWLDVYQPRVYHRLGRVWQPALAVFLSAPLATLLRGLLLNTVIVPVFVVVLGASLALGMVVWRLAFAAWSSRHG